MSDDVRVIEAEEQLVELFGAPQWYPDGSRNIAAVAIDLMRVPRAKPMVIEVPAVGGARSICPTCELPAYFMATFADGGGGNVEHRRCRADHPVDPAGGC